MSADKRVFIAFAIEDRNYRDLLKGQSLNTDSPFSLLPREKKSKPTTCTMPGQLG